MADRRGIAQQIGDACREGAVLIAVLYPLETIVSAQFDSARKIDLWGIIIAEVIAGILFYWGVILEGRDEP